MAVFVSKNELLDRLLVSVTVADDLLARLNRLRQEGTQLEPGNDSEVTVTCNTAVVQFKDGPIGTVVLERDSTKLWTVSEIR